MRRIGIMGGTFNPIHNGHLMIAKTAKDQFSLDKVLFMPSGVPYMKNRQEVLPVGIRCEMTALAIADTPYFELSKLEAADAEHGKSTYTFETLQKLRRADPEAEYYFILGADSLYAIEGWKNPALIFENCTVLVAVREDVSDLKKSSSFFPSYKADAADNPVLQNKLACQAAYLREKYHGTIAILKTPAMNVSSTQIRNFVNEGISIHGLVPDAVEYYVYHHRLYQNQII